MYKPFLVILDLYQVLYSSVVRALYSFSIYQVLYSSAYTGTVQFQAAVLFSVYLIEEGLSSDKLRILIDRQRGPLDCFYRFPVSGSSGTLCVFSLADRCCTPCLVVPHRGYKLLEPLDKVPPVVGRGPATAGCRRCHLSGFASPLAIVF